MRLENAAEVIDLLRRIAVVNERITTFTEKSTLKQSISRTGIELSDAQFAGITQVINRLQVMHEEKEDMIRRLSEL